jgi:hypothetical protein
MKRRKTDLIFNDSDKIKKEPPENFGQANWKRSKWLKWLLRIVDNVVTALT